MNFSGLIENIHWIPVIIATAFSFVIGALWHSPFLFGKIWKKEINPSNIEIKYNMPLLFGGTGIMHFLAISGISAVASGHGALYGAAVGLAISIVWILPAITGTYLFAGRSLKLIAIDCGNYIIMFSLSGLILGVW
jgi:hypothetical protein